MITLQLTEREAQLIVDSLGTEKALAKISVMDYKNSGLTVDKETLGVLEAKHRQFRELQSKIAEHI